MRSHAKASTAGSISSKSGSRGFVALLVSILAMLAFAPAAALASHKVDRFIGGSAGSLQGQFQVPTGVAVNQATGQVYLDDLSLNNNRVQRFDAAGSFERTWGKDVKGGGGAEICTAADIPCAAGAKGSGEGMFNGVQLIGISPVNGHIYTIEREDLRVQEFDGDGNFIRMWGWGVDDGSDEFQVCTVGCQAALNRGQGSQPGQFGSLQSIGNGIAVSPIDGDVFVADSGNSRIQRFNSDGTLDIANGAIVGSSSNFSSGQPAAIAIDSAGMLYASDSNNSGEIDRYDTVGNAFTASIAAPPLLAAEGSGTRGLAVDPDSDGAGADIDRLMVLRDPAAGNTVIQQIDEPAAAVPALGDTHALNSFGTFSSGLTGLGVLQGVDPVDPAQDRFYVPAGFGNQGGPGFYILDADGTGSAINATIASATDVTPTSATLNGTVDPADGLAKFHFEYTADGSSWTSLPEEGVEGGGPQAVSQDVAGLTPHALYRVRLVAVKVLGPEDVKTVTTSEAILLTAVAAPAVETRPVHQYDDTSAWLAADVNPNNQSTTYRFEWGTTASYGNLLPVPNAQAGSGGTARAFLQKLSGLQPGATYHYRVVATNDTGTSKGADQSFTTRPLFEGFEARAFEQATPQNKLNDIGTLFGAHVSAMPVAADGSSVAFQTQGSLGGSDWGQGLQENIGLSHRTPTGWSTDPIRPEPVNKASTAPFFRAFGGSDLSRQLLAVPYYGLRNVGPAGLYIQDSNADSFELLADLGEEGIEARVSSATKDLGHVAFSTPTVLTSDPGAPAFGRKAYEWADGELRLVAVQPDGTAFPEASIVGSDLGSIESASARNALSSDGNHIFFTTPLSPGLSDESRIYRRDNGTDTILVSPSKRTPPDPAGSKAKLFLDATQDQGPDGPAAVFFASKEKLTNQPTSAGGEGSALGDLYRYEINTDTLTNISAETNDAGGAEVLGMAGRSEDGAWVYYVARGQVLAGQGIAGEPSLYLWHDDGTASGATRLVATLAGNGCAAAPDLLTDAGAEAAFMVGDSCNYSESARSARVLADGQTLLFQSSRSLTGYDNNGFNQVYLYKAAGGGQLVCVSCDPGGAAAQANALLARTSQQGSANQDLIHTLSSDGRRVFITTREALLSADTNGKQDVYEWEAGHLRLISAGTGAFDSVFYGATPSGNDAFIKTRDALVGIDRDGGVYDIYDVRVGGGIAEQNPPPPGAPCVGEECKASPPSQPGAAPPGSASLVGSGNAKSGTNTRHRCRKGQRKVRRAGKVRCVKQHGSRKSTRKHG